MKTCVIFGSGGFLGTNLSLYLISKNYKVIGISSHKNEFVDVSYSNFLKFDLRNYEELLSNFPQDVDDVYQLASNTYSNDNKQSNYADILADEILININILKICILKCVKKIFFASSYSVYSEFNDNNIFTEIDIYNGKPFTQHGWSKFICEQIYKTYQSEYKLDIKIGRFHTIYGQYGYYEGIKKKFVNYLCKEIYTLKDCEQLNINGDVNTQRQIMHVNEWCRAVHEFMNSSYSLPLNISSENPIKLIDLIETIKLIAKKNISINYNSNIIEKNRIFSIKMLKDNLNWKPSYTLEESLRETYEWITTYIKHSNNCNNTI